MTKYYLTVNPHGGIKKGLNILNKVLPLFKSKNFDVTVIETKYAGHARDLVKDIDMTGYDGFCCIGGDGTMHEAINGLLKRKDRKRFPLGLITGGTGNSFMCDMDCQDPVEATKRILAGNSRKIDILECNSSGEVYYAFNLIGWGMPTDINNLAEKMRWLGTQRYNVATIIQVIRNSKRFAELKFENETIREDFAFIIGCNTIHVGKGMKMAPMAKLDDGYLDLIIVRKAKRLTLLKLFPKLFTGEHIGSKELEYKQVKSFSIYPKEKNMLNIDGELLGTTPVNVKVLHKEVEVLI